MLRSFDLVEVADDTVTLGFIGTHTEMSRSGKRRKSKSKKPKGNQSRRSTKKTGGGSKGKGRTGGISIGKPPQNWEIAYINDLMRPFVGYNKKELDLAFDEAIAELVRQGKLVS